MMICVFSMSRVRASAIDEVETAHLPCSFETIAQADLVAVVAGERAKLLKTRGGSTGMISTAYLWDLIQTMTRLPA